VTGRKVACKSTPTPDIENVAYLQLASYALENGAFLGSERHAATIVGRAGLALYLPLGGVAFAVLASQVMPIVFGLMSPLLALAFVLAVLLPARPLRTTAYVEERV
jgi:hypothetical protein